MRIILADPHLHALWALRTTLQEDSELEIVGEATDSLKLLEIVNTQCADLLLLDCGLRGMPVQELIPILHSHEPRPIVVIMSSDIHDGRKMLIAGADAFASKADQPIWLVDRLRQYAITLQAKYKPE